MDHGSLPSLIQGRYRYLSDLGAGGMGRVVLVEDLEEGGLERALKWVPASQPASAREIRHLREFEVLSRFQHPHILRVFSYGRVLPAVGQFFTCEPLRGPPLTALVGGTGEEEARGILVQLLRALAFLHNQGWVHGDIKPENVCLRRPGEDGDPEACLLDFGIAHAEGRPPEERVLGTVHYISPERILGGRIDRRGDLYSLGVLAYHLLTGNTPFSGPRKVDVLEGHLRGIPPRPGLRRPGLSQVLEETVLALLEKRPADRPADAEEVLRIFQQEWGDLGGPEDRNTLRAYIRVRDDVGWREEIDSALQGVHRRVGEPFEVFQRWQQAAERFVDGSRPLLPSLYRSGAGSRVGMLRIRSSSSADLKLFRRRLQRELQVRGVPLLEVGGPRNTPFVDLVRGLPTLLPVTGDGSGDCLRGLAVPLRAAAQGEPPVVVVQGVVRWLASHARKQPLVILLHSMEAWEESFFRLLTEVACSEMRDPSLTRIAWLGLQGPAQGLFLGQWQSEPRTRSWCRTVDLPRFDEATIGRWFEARFGGWNAPTELRYLLEEESEGSPAVAGRLLTALVDDGLVDRGWSGWSISDLGSEPYRSPLVRRAIRALGSLNAGERQVLAALVILGGSADAESILHASGIDAGKMVETFVGLKRKGWLAEEEERSRYRLSHSFQRKAVRDSIEARTWREGNLRVAGRLLQMGEEAAPAQRIAHHLMEGGAAAEAIPHAHRAAREALREGQVLTGIRWLERILRHVESVPPERLAPILADLSELRQIWGPPEEALRLRRGALQAAVPGRGDPPEDAVLARKLAHLEGLAGNFRSATARMKKVLVALTARRNDDELRRSFLTIAELHLSRGSPQDSKDLWPALERLEDPADRTLLASGRLLRVDHCLTQGHLLLAAEICREAILEFDGDDEPPIAPWIPLLLGRLFEIEGRWLAAIHQYRLAASMFRRIKDPLREARLLIRVGELCRRTGQILESEDSLKRAERLIDRTGAEADRPRLAWNRGLLLARSGWIREARGVLRIAADWGRRFPTTPWSWEVALVEAESSLRSGALDHTRELLEAEAHPSRAPHRHSPETWLRWGLLSTELAMRSARPRAALDVNRLALGEVRERGDLFQQIPLWIARWRILDTLGCVEEAERLAAELTGWLQRYPEHGHAWAAARGELIEDLGACCGDEEDLARFHLSRAHEAAGRGDPGEALFLLEEAHFHARRVRALPLSATIAAHLAMVRRRVFDDSEDPESTLQASWAQLAHAGVVQGRIEILTLWAEARRSAGDEAAAESLERAVERALDRWVVEIPFPHDREILAERMGARHATARHAEQEVEA